MVKNTLYNSGQVIDIAIGETYTLKSDEVMVNSVIYKKQDLIASVVNNSILSSVTTVLLGVRKRDGVKNLPVVSVKFNEWAIDDVTQTSVGDCFENIVAALFTTETGGVSFTQQVNQYNDLVAGITVGDLAYVENSQGTAWLPFALGGTYYPAGVYRWDGVVWVSDRNAIANELSKLDDRLNDIGNINAATLSLNFDLFETWTAILTENLTLSFLNPKVKVVTLDLTGNFTITYPVNTDVVGDAYDGTKKNKLTIEWKSAADILIINTIRNP